MAPLRSNAALFPKNAVVVTELVAMPKKLLVFHALKLASKDGLDNLLENGTPPKLLYRVKPVVPVAVGADTVKGWPITVGKSNLIISPMAVANPGLMLKEEC